MLEKLNKVQIIHIIAMIIMITCSLIVIIAAIDGIEKNKDIIHEYFNLGLMGVLGWAFTQSKSKSNPQ